MTTHSKLGVCRHLQLFFLLCLVFRMSKNHEIFMYSVPVNTVGVVGKSVVLECSLSHGSVDVQWFYSMDGRNNEILTKNIQYKRKKFFKKVDVLFNATSDLYIYNLRVNDIKLEDSGFYSCLLSYANRTIIKTAQLSVINVYECKSYVLGYKLTHMCIIETTGNTDYSFSWKCDREAESFKSQNQTAVWNLINKLVPVQLFTIGVELNIMVERTIRVCDFEAIVIHQKPSKEQHVDHSIPFFEMILGFQQFGVAIKLDGITDCILEADGEMKFDHYFIFFNTYNAKNNFIPTMRPDKYICSLDNMFISKPFKEQTTQPPQPPSNLYARCDMKNGLKCLGFFVPYISKETNFVDVDVSLYKKLCANQRDVIVCIDSIQPCFMTKNLKGLMEAYRYFCSSDYALLRPEEPKQPVDPAKCFEHYPQIMTRLLQNAHVKIEHFLEPPARTPVLHKAFCSYLSELANSYCIEHLIATRSSLAMSDWFQEFYMLLKQVQDNNLFSFKEELVVNHLYLLDCKGSFRSDKEAFECKQAHTCAPILCSDFLLSKI